MTHHDDAVRKETEATLRLFKDLVQHSSDAIGMADPDGRHYCQNRTFDRLFGEVGEHPPETGYVDRTVGIQVFATAKAGEDWEGEVEMFKQDRTILPIHLRAFAIKDQTGRVTALVGQHTDITERKRTEDALWASEQKRVKESPHCCDPRLEKCAHN